MGKPGVPTGLEISWLEGQVKVKWVAPAETGGKSITGYSLKSGAAKDDLTAVTDGPSGTSTEWTTSEAQQADKRDIFFAVAATNEDGTGDFTDAKSATVPAFERPEITARNYVFALIAVAVIVVALRFVVAKFLPDPSALNPTLGNGVADTAAAAYGHAVLKAAGQIAVELVAWGIAFLVAAFVPLSIAAALAAVKIKAEASGRSLTTATTIPSIDLSGTLKATGELLRTPSGFGGLLVASGVLLMILALYSPPANPSAEASPSPTPSASVPPTEPATGSPGPPSAAPGSSSPGG